MTPASSPVTPDDLVHLDRCVELAREALAAGDEPFGSILVGSDGDVLFADRNRVSGGNGTLHPEFTITQWAVEHLDADRRAATTVYTSGEHCAMCSAAHAWVGLGRIVYAVSGAQLTAWQSEWGVPPGPVRAVPIGDIAPGIVVHGPADTLVEVMRELHHRNALRKR